jgi:hypothetical protein
MDFKKFSTTNEEINRLQSNCDSAFKYLLSNLLNNAIILQDIALTTGSINKIEHKLGKKNTGYIIVSNNTNNNIWNNTVPTNIEHLYMYLSCSSNCTVSIIVF